ncbi:cytochrome P450 [Streptomyces sp. NBC_01304]|uniref:cytochrome P450 n=1 Tax=Streptomyces sp. NBC_01304 TaxID=2903818 RepID=UPI003FA38D9E|nr:cytochrome P450 [Streptomyces sp. NBC_01304]
MVAPTLPLHPVPGPRGLPLIGNLLAYGSDPLAFLTRLRDDFGDAVTWSFGPWRSLLISHPTHIGEHFEGIGRSYRTLAPPETLKRVIGKSVLTSQDDEWRRKRSLVQPAVRPRQVRGYATTMVDCAEALADSWKDGQRVDVVREMYLLMQRIVAQTLFGNDIGKQADTLSTALSAALAEIGREVRSISLLFPPWVSTPARRRMRTATATINTEIHRLIQDRKNAADRTEPRDDLLSRLLAARDEDGLPLSSTEVRDEAVTLWFAGQETTATTLTWIWHLLSTHPTARAVLTEELDRVLAGRPPAFDDYERLTWTEQIVKEALRLYPPGWALAARAQEGASLGGLPVRAGTTVWCSPWSLHRDPRWFPDPTAFRPERWDVDAPHMVPTHAWIPFGGGQRICLGARFAMVAAVMTVATLAQRFHIDLDIAPGGAAPVAGLTLTPTGPLHATLHAVRPLTAGR